MEIDSLQLIQTVKSFPELYDSAKQDFKIVEKKEQAWETIAKSFHITVIDCKKRWRAMREKYTRELKRMSNANDKIISPGTTWEFFESLHFLSKHIRYRRRRSGKKKLLDESNQLTDNVWPQIKPETSTSKNDHEHVYKQYLGPALQGGIAEEEEDYFVDPIENTEYNENQQNTEKQLKQHMTPSIDENYNKDENDYFCSSVACTLRKLTKVNNVKAKVEIYKVLERFVELENTKASRK